MSTSFSEAHSPLEAATEEIDIVDAVAVPEPLSESSAQTAPEIKAPPAVPQDWLVERITAAAEAHAEQVRAESDPGATEQTPPTHTTAVATLAKTVVEPDVQDVDSDPDASTTEPLTASRQKSEARDFTSQPLRLDETRVAPELAPEAFQPARSEPVCFESEPPAIEQARKPTEHAPASWMPRAKTLAIAGARFAAYCFVGYLALVLVLIALYRFVHPPASTLMVYRWLGGADIAQTWVPIEDISPHLVRAVVVSEDAHFCNHWGIDLGAVREAIESADDGVPRGASTLSMQVAKNIFLWPSRSYIRKLIEIPITLVMELVWPKRRMLEIYLNVAEWGPGIFGAEAAARHHFNKPAARLNQREAALLAASLPNPFRRDAGDPGPRTTRKAGIVQARMRASGNTIAACVLGDR